MYISQVNCISYDIDSNPIRTNNIFFADSIFARDFILSLTFRNHVVLFSTDTCILNRNAFVSFDDDVSLMAQICFGYEFEELKAVLKTQHTYGHPDKLFRFSSPFLSLKWVGGSVG